MNLLCLLSICLQASLGYAVTTPPPDGTWWESGQPHQWDLKSKMWDVGIGGSLPKLWGIESRWAVEYANLGVQTSEATACSANEPKCTSGAQAMSHWSGRQHPRGAWASWEPHIWGPISAKIGGGMLQPTEFTMEVPDWIGCLKTCGPQSVAVDSGKRWHPSYILGAIASYGPADFIVANRFLYIPNASLVHSGVRVQEYTNLSKSAWTFSVRWRL